MVQIRLLTALKIKQRLEPGMYPDGLGLYLRVGPGNARSWIFRYRVRGKLRDMGLGAVHSVTLAEAREKAASCRALRASSSDPIEEKRAASSKASLDALNLITFHQCADAYIDAHQTGWKNAKHAGQWAATLQTYVYPIFKDTPVAQIDRDLVLKVLRPIWTEKTETASRVRGRIERVLDWARVNDFRTGDNPARWRGHLDHILPRRTKVSSIVHHAALPIDDIPSFVSILRNESSITARAFEFCILTATRTNETLRMRWVELDERNRIWTVPAARMKAGKDHRVALSDRTLAILSEMKLIRMSEYVFPGGRPERPLSSMVFLMMLRRLHRHDITAHGFRSTFRDWAAERTDYSSEAIEMALAHTISDKVDAAYRRGDLMEKRRQLAKGWADFCGSVPRIR